MPPIHLNLDEFEGGKTPLYRQKWIYLAAYSFDTIDTVSARNQAAENASS